MATNGSYEEHLEATVNPADLFMRQNDQQMTPDPIGLGMTYNHQPSVPTEPIWIPEPPQITQQPAHDLPYTGWDSLTPNGDVNYSSYGSSPADNTIDLRLMVQRFGHYNLSVGRGSSFERPDMSRATSFSSFEQHSHSHSPAGEPWQQKYTSRRTRRGRLLADMSSPGTETVFEDSDSHHSWTAADNVENWCAYLRERLAEFRKNKQRVSIITSPLQTRQRRKVHSMANLLGLSHTSLGTGREKRVLICKCELTKSRAQMIEKRWNPSRNNWSPGLVDPRIVLFDLVSPKLSIGRFQECLADAGLPLPVKVTIDCFNPIKPGMSQPVATAYAMFKNTDDAALVLLELDGKKPNWNGIDVELECDYVHFPPGFDLSAQALDNFGSLPDTLRMERLRVQHGNDISRISSRSTNSALYSDSESDSGLYNLGLSTSCSSRGLRSRGTSNDSWYSRDPGYVSAGSNRSPLHSDYSSTSRKRKRVPKISGGYSCTLQGCDRIFDRDGDRRKHEKNHAGDRPHVCHKCGKGFLFPKDLRRHMIVHSITSLPSSNEDGPGMEEAVSPPAENRMTRAKQSISQGK